MIGSSSERLLYVTEIRPKDMPVRQYVLRDTEYLLYAHQFSIKYLIANFTFLLFNHEDTRGVQIANNACFVDFQRMLCLVR